MPRRPAPATARSTGRSASSPGPSRSRRPPRCRTGRRSISAGGGRSTASPAPRGRSASPRNGGANDEELTRDYFRVEDAAGHRFWLFREGLYGRETRPALVPARGVRVTDAVKLSARHASGLGAPLLALDRPTERIVQPGLPARPGPTKIFDAHPRSQSDRWLAALVGVFCGPRRRGRGKSSISGKTSRAGRMMRANCSSVNGGKSTASQSSWEMWAGFLTFCHNAAPFHDHSLSAS